MKKLIMGLLVLVLFAACSEDKEKLEITTLMIDGIETTTVIEGTYVELSVEAMLGDELRELSEVQIDAENGEISIDEEKIMYLASDAYMTDILMVEVVDSEGKRAESNIEIDITTNPVARINKIVIDGETNYKEFRAQVGKTVEIDIEFTGEIIDMNLTAENGEIVYNGINYMYTAPSQAGIDTLEIEVEDLSGKRNIVKDIEVFDEKELTFMIYLGADNNLDYFAKLDIEELIAANMNLENVNVIIFLDLYNETDASRGYIELTENENDIIEGMPNVKLIKFTGEKNSGDWNTFKDFLDFTAKNYPAKKYILDIWNHGDGWYNDHNYTNPFIRGKRAIVSDDSSNGDDLSLWEVEYAILNSDLKKVDLIYMDACLMGGVEVAYQLKDVSDYIYFSPELTPGKGGDYTGIGEVLSENYDKPIELIATEIITRNLQSYQPGGNQYSEGTTESLVYTLIDQSKTNEFVEKLNLLSDQMIQEIEVIQSIPNWTFMTYDAINTNNYNIATSFVDLGSFAEQISASNAASIELKARAEDVLAYLLDRDKYIVDYRYQNGVYSGFPIADQEGTYGLSIYIPLKGSDKPNLVLPSDYYINANRFSQNTSWGDFVTEYEK